MKDKALKKWLYWFLLAVAIIVVYKTLDNFTEISHWISTLLGVVSPFLVGILVAYLLYIPCKNIELLFKKSRFRLVASKARAISVLIVYLIAFVIILLAINFLIPALTQSIGDLVNNSQVYYNNTINNYNELPEESLLKSGFVNDIINNIKNIDLKQFVNMDRIGEYAKGVISVAGGIFDIFVSVVVSVYVLLERKEILGFIRKIIHAILGKNIGKNIGKYFHKTNDIFFKFVASQFLDAIVVGILTSIAMSIMGIRYAILLGVMIGLFNMIPYFGAIIAVGISIIITILTEGMGTAVWMAIVVIILQQIDANIINPKIVGTSLKISPLLVVFAVAFGGAYFGILGMFLAVPIAAVCKILLTDYINIKNGKGI